MGLSVRLVFVERQAATAYISEQVGTDDHDGIITYDTNGKIGIRQLDDLPTNLRNVASDLTDVEQGGLRTKLGFHHFDIPRNYVLPIGLRFTSDLSPSNYSVPANTLFMCPVHLHERGDYQYAPLLRLPSGNSTGVGSVRVTLYTWHEGKNGWASSETALIDDLTEYETGDYNIADWLSLPSEYADYMVSGVAVVGIQASSSNIILVSSKGTNSVLDPALRPSFRVGAAGTAHQATVSHPTGDTAFLGRLAHLAYRRHTVI